MRLYFQNHGSTCQFNFHFFLFQVIFINVYGAKFEFVHSLNLSCSKSRMSFKMMRL